MESPEIAGLEQTVVDPENNRVNVLFERGLYPLDAVYGAAYIFIDRCFVLLDAPSATHIKVELTGREPLDPGALRDLAGEFGNELLAQTWRRQVTQQNMPIIEAVAARALAGSTEPAGADDFDDIEFSDDAFDDPLGIAVPWEEKYGKDTAEASGDQAPAPEGKGDRSKS